MHTSSRGSFVAAFLASFLLLPFHIAQAAETPAAQTDPLAISVTGEPAAYTFVEGDASKFRALNWEPVGYVGGVKDFTASGELQNGVEFESEGRVVPQEGDYKGAVSFKKEDLGYLKFYYDEFRKYYSNDGGFYRPYVHLADPSTDKELALNIGKFGVEAGLTMKNIPDIVLNYERDFKEGTKSRLTWATVYDTAPLAGAGAIQRKTAPSWENLDEITDSFNIKISDVFKEFNWNADQHWEFTRAKDMREDRNLATTATASNYQVVDVYQAPRTDLMATTFGLNRWFLKDKVYASSGYRFSQVNARELFKMFTLNPDGSYLPGGTNYLDSPSDNLFTTQSWVASLMTTLLDPLTAITKFKVETSHRQSWSRWEADSSTAPAVPDGIANTMNVSENQEKVMRYGESVSFRYGGIPGVAVYNDYEFEQAQDNLSKYRQSVAANDLFNMQVMDSINRWSGTLGAQAVPWEHVTMTIQGRHKSDDNGYDPTQYISGESASNLQTWIKEQRISTDEASARIAWKPSLWFQPSFRYQLSDQGYKTWAYPNNAIPVDTALILNTYTSEVISQPTDDLLLSASVSFQDGKVITPDRFTGLPESVPTFNLDVCSLLFSAEYSVSKDLMLTGTADYSRASNFQDFSSIGMPYGADFHKADLIFGVRWTPKKDLTIEPKYAYYQYQANEAEFGDYNAQMISLEVKTNWG